MYAADPDPWRFETSDYERGKYAETLRALGNRRWRNVLELGCSIGVMSALLGERADRLLGVDISETALGRARARCAEMPHLRFLRAALPDGFPRPAAGEDRFDLVLVSELLYFLVPADIDRLAARMAAGCTPGATVLLVNWTGETNTPCTGDAAAERARMRCEEAGFTCDAPSRQERYRIDRMTAPGPSGTA